MKTIIKNTILFRNFFVTGAMTLAVLAPMAQAAQGPQPTICTRSCWGARASTGCSSMSSLNRAIIHHTAGSGDYTTNYETAKSKVRGVQNLHMDANGWCDIAYHFLVSAGGHIFEGRAGSMSGLPRGSHDCANNNSFGFNVMGYYHPPANNAFTAASQNALEAVIAWRMPSSWSPYGSGSYSGCEGTKTVGFLDGHYKVKATACPGDGIIPSIPDIRNGVDDRKNGGGGNSGPVTVAGPSICSWSPGRLDVFWKGGDGLLKHSYYNSSVSGTPPFRNDIVAISAFGTVVHKFYQSGTGWSGWGNVPSGAWSGVGSEPGAINSAPDTCSWGTDRFDIVALGPNNTVLHKYYIKSTATWSGWGDLGGVATSAPTVCAWGNRLHVFVRGLGNALFHKYYQTGVGWSGWGLVSSTPISSSPDSCVTPGGQLHVVAKLTSTGTVGHAYYNPSTASWSAWGQVSSVKTLGKPSINTNGNGRYDVYWRGESDQQLKHAYNTGSGWSSTGTESGALISGVDSVCWNLYQ